MASMTSMASERLDRAVVAGIDTHRDVHVAALLDGYGAVVGTASFTTTRDGYAALTEWLHSAGTLLRVGIEGTGSYGAAITRRLVEAGVEVVEVNRPDRSDRRRRGKSDTLDAVAAARAALAGERTAIPKSHHGPVETIRVLRLTRSSAVQARADALQLIRQLLVTAPDHLRDQVRDLTRMALIRTCARWRPAGHHDPAAATRTAVTTLARRYLQLDQEINKLDAILSGLIAEHAPDLVAAIGISTETAGQLLVTAGGNPDRIHSEAAFAMLAGVAPLPASSGTTQRHRLNRGGDRQANRAIHIIATTRKRCHPPTQAYLAKKIAEGHSNREATRCLKRLIAREIYYLLPGRNPNQPPAPLKNP